jgi:Xaa-Pro aminopeptidase
MMKEEGLEGLGFQLLEHEWYADREAELIEKVVGNLTKVGADAGFGSCRNIEDDIRKLRVSLNENEVERYLFLGEKLSRCLEEVMLGIRPGDTECGIAGRIGAKLWEDRIDPTAFQIAADERAFRFRHPIPTKQKVERYVVVCVNARYQGLITTITRILHFGSPDPKLLEQFEDNHEIECRMIAATKPGVPASVPFEKGLEAYRELGYEAEWQLHNQGGAMGYYARDLRVTRETKDIVEENQAFCWNPSIAGTKTEDGFIATKNGPVMITRPIVYPRIEYRKNGIDIVKPGLLVLD